MGAAALAVTASPRCRSRAPRKKRKISGKLHAAQIAARHGYELEEHSLVLYVRKKRR